MEKREFPEQELRRFTTAGPAYKKCWNKPFYLKQKDESVENFESYD